MKLKKFSLFLPLMLGAAHAAPIVRNDAAVNLNLVEAWVGGVLPAGADVATWNASSSLSNTLGANLSWGALDLTSASGVVSISGNNNLGLNHEVDANTIFNAGSNGFTWGVAGTGGSFNINGAAGTGSVEQGATFAGSGLVTLNSTGSKNWSTINSTNGVTNVTFTGTLALRGATIPAVGTLSGNWLAFGGGGATATSEGILTQTGAFALDTGDDASCGSFILSHALNGRFLKLSRLSGTGSLRADWAGIGAPSAATVVRGLELDQATDSVFAGSIFGHNSSNLRRNLSIVKKGAGTLVFSKGAIGTSGGLASVSFDIQGGVWQFGDGLTNPVFQGNGTWDPASTFSIGSGGTLRFKSATELTFARNLSGAGTVEITSDGSPEVGQVVFTGNHASFSGDVDLDGGSLRIGPNLGTGTLTVATGTSFSVGLPANAGASQVGELVIQPGTSSTFRLGGQNDSVTVLGDLVPPASGTHIIHLSGAPVSGGTIKLVDYTGDALSGDEFARFQIGDEPVGSAIYQLVNNTAESSIDLVINLEDQVWKGTDEFESDVWNSEVKNWALVSNPGEAVWYDFDRPVLFDDTGLVTVVFVEESLPFPKLTFSNSAQDYTLGGVGLTGTGVVVKNGTGKVTFENNNAYSGSTTINSGILSIGKGEGDGDIGSGPVVVGENGTLLFDRNEFTVLDYKATPKMRNVSGSGDIVLDGGLRLFNYTGSGLGFADANSWAGFSGDLIIKGGSEFQTIRNGATAMGTGNVILGDVSTSGSLSGVEGNWTWTNNIILNGPANRFINRATGNLRATKIQGVISGAGGIIFEDAAGSMDNVNRGFVLTGENVMNGQITISSGTPLRVGGVPGNADATQLGAADFGSLGDATVVNNGTLTFSRTGAHAVDNAISGPGNLRIGIPSDVPLGDTSTQVLTYQGSATHTGTTTVINGTLVVSSGASLGGSSIIVEPQGTLTGIGTIAGPLASAGTIAPGNGIGVLPVTGNTTITGNLVIDLDGASVDKLMVTGDLNLTGSSVSLNLLGGGFTQTSYVIAESSGTMTGLPAAPSGYSLQVVANQLVISVSEASAFEEWAELNAGGQTPEEDFDGDGVPNGVEYFMGETGSSFTANPSVVTADGVRTVTWPRDPDAAASYTIQTSETLAAGEWTDITPPDDSIDDSDPSEVVFTLPENGKIFIRLAVTVDP